MASASGVITLAGSFCRSRAALTAAETVAACAAAAPTSSCAERISASRPGDDSLYFVKA